MEPVFVRYREPKIHLDFRADVGFTKRQIYAFLEAQDIRYTTRVPANQVLRNRNGHLLTRPVRRPPRSRS